MPEITQEKLVEIELIRRTIIQYSHLMDSCRFEEWRDLFTEHAEFWSIPGHHLPGGHEISKIIGREAIVKAVREVERRMAEAGGVIHFSASPIVNVDGETANAWWDFIVVHAKPEGTTLPFCGRYYAEFVKEGGRWRFRKRVAVRPGYPIPASLVSSPGI